MSNDLLSCEALEKLIQQEIGELDMIQKKLTKKQENPGQKEDLLEYLNNPGLSSGLEQTRSPATPSHLGFGRPSKGRPSRQTINHSATPQRTGQKDQIPNNIKGVATGNLNQNKVRALVYQDKSSSKIEEKGKNVKIRPSRELSISSDGQSEEDSNQPLDDTEDVNSGISPNRSTQTLKKKKVYTRDIKQIQQRKTKLSVNYDKPTKNTHQEQSTVHVKSKNDKVAALKKADNNAPNKKITERPKANKSIDIIPKKNSQKPMVTEKTKINNNNNTPILTYNRPKQAAANKSVYIALNKSTSVPNIQAKPQLNDLNKKKNHHQPSQPEHNKAQREDKSKSIPRSKTPVALSKINNVETKEEKNKKEEKFKKIKRMKEPLLKESMFNNDDLFAKLNQLTKLNKKMEKQSLIEDGLIDPDRNNNKNKKNKIVDNDDSFLSEGFGSENSDVLIPETKAIEHNLRSKIQTNKANKKQEVMVATNKNKQQKNNSFIEKQLQEFKEQRQRKIRPSEIDFDRHFNSKHKKKTTELKSECTFQPMLSKKSLNMADKLGEVSERLYNKKSLNYSKTPEKSANKENTFAPKISAKSVYLDQKKAGYGLTRHERLLQMGEKYSANIKVKKQDKEIKENHELRSHSFKPTTQEFKGTVFDVSLAERASRWAEKREEKVKRKKQEIDEREGQICSFRPNINIENTINQVKNPESLYSSRFLQDGIKSYFTRLEQARKIKREATDRLENWGRSKSTRKQNNLNQSAYCSASSFQTPVKGRSGEQIKHVQRPKNNNAANSQFNPSFNDNFNGKNHNQNNGIQPYTDKSISDTINLLRKNLQGINIHLGN